MSAIKKITLKNSAGTPIDVVDIGAEAENIDYNNSSSGLTADDIQSALDEIIDKAIIQVTTMPTASAAKLGKVYQYIGITTTTYTHNYFYECISNGAATPTYSWQRKDVQPGGGGGSALKYTIDGIDNSYAVIQNGTEPIPFVDPSGTPITIPANIASGMAAIAAGAGTVASGVASHAEGYMTTASGMTATAKGIMTLASGAISSAEGQQTTAQGSGSHSEGFATLAYLDTCHAEGDHTTAIQNAAHSEGMMTKAIGTSAHAEGYGTCAVGHSAHAEGFSDIIHDNPWAIAFEDGSHAEGDGTTALGYASHAEGEHTSAVQTSAHAEGRATIAFGNQSHAEGYETTGLGEFSHAEGYKTCAAGDNSHAEGEENKTIGNASHAEGSHTLANGYTSHSEGTQTSAIGTTSHAEGNLTCAVGNNSHAEGNQTCAAKLSSHAEGEKTIADGYTSHAEGLNTSAISTGSHAEGYATCAINDSSHAEGARTTACGLYSHSQNNYTIAQGLSQTVIGKFNTAEGYPTSFANTDYAFIIGNGTNDTHRSNAFTIQWNGQMSQDNGSTSFKFGKDNTNHKGYKDEAGNFNRLHLQYTIDGADNTYATIQNLTEDLTVDGTTIPKNVATGLASHAEGISTSAVSEGAHAEGYQTSAANTYAHAEGWLTTASGDSSHAEGGQTIADTDAAHAEGFQTSAIGTGSHAEGMQTSAVETGAHAEGEGTTASGVDSHTEGNHTLASADYSHAEGAYTMAQHPLQHVQGEYNDNKSNTLFEIGNGTESTRSNAFEVYEDGKLSTDNGVTKVKLENLVLNNDARLSDDRNAADVYPWAKASTKPIYTATEVGAIASTAKGANNGVAELDSTGKVPSSQLPSFVDDVLEYDSLSAFPTTGEAGKIYIAKDTNKTYRWSGTAYAEISASLALGETSSTAYRGDRGKIAYDHSQSTHARTDATKVEASSTNGNIKINGTETTVYTHPGSGTNPHGTTKSDVGLGNVGNFLAVSTVASQGLSDTQKSNARANIGAGTSNFSGNYNDLSNKPTIPTVNNATLTIQKNGTNVKTFTANASSDVTANITVPTKVSELTNDSGYTTNAGTITGITMNGASKGTSGVVNLGTVITAHQDISGKADKPTVKSAALAANATSVTFTGIPTSGNNLIDFFITDGSNYTAINTATSGQITLTYAASSSARTVYCRIEGV